MALIEDIQEQQSIDIEDIFSYRSKDSGDNWSGTDSSSNRIIQLADSMEFKFNFTNFRQKSQVQRDDVKPRSKTLQRKTSSKYSKVPEWVDRLSKPKTIRSKLEPIERQNSVSRSALKYEATQRIIELAKPRHRVMSVYSDAANDEKFNYVPSERTMKNEVQKPRWL